MPVLEVTRKSAKILVAASSAPRVIAERILMGHKLYFADTMVQAERLLREKAFDLIICTIAFDESRMFDLLAYAKSKQGLKRTPFVCARLRRHVLRSPAAMKAVTLTCETLGADAFLDVGDFRDDAECKIRDAIDRILNAAA